MAQTVKVGCKLPNGLVITIKNKDVVLKGANTDPAAQSPIAVVLNSDFFGTTDVEKDFIEAWLKKHAKDPAVVNRSIFIIKDAASAKEQAKDADKTGLEGQAQASDGVKTVKDE